MKDTNLSLLDEVLSARDESRNARLWNKEDHNIEQILSKNP